MTAPDYKTIAEDAVSLLCTLGYLGLDRSQERRLWQEALNLDRKLHPWRERVTVWTPEEGDIDPPRREPAAVTSTRGNTGGKQGNPHETA